MNAAEVLTLVSPLQILGVFAVGLAFGLVILMSAVHPHPVPVAVLMVLSGAGYFVFLVVLRALEAVPNWERSIGTGLMWLAYTAGTFTALALAERQRAR